MTKKIYKYVTVIQLYFLRDNLYDYVIGSYYII